MLLLMVWFVIHSLHDAAAATGPSDERWNDQVRITRAVADLISSSQPRSRHHRSGEKLWHLSLIHELTPFGSWPEKRQRNRGQDADVSQIENFWYRISSSRPYADMDWLVACAMAEAPRFDEHKNPLWIYIYNSAPKLLLMAQPLKHPQSHSGHLDT